MTSPFLRGSNCRSARARVWTKQLPPAYGQAGKDPGARRSAAARCSTATRRRAFDATAVYGQAPDPDGARASCASGCNGDSVV